MQILVTGATGKLGGHVVETLLARGLGGQVAVSVRDPGKAAGLAARGVDVRQGDFDDLDSLRRAFAGVERLLIVSTTDDTATRIRQHQTAVRAAQDAGVSFIAYTSITDAENNPLEPAKVHRATEEAIRATGIPYAFLRNNWYLENEMGAVQAALAGAPLATSAGQGRVGWALRADYAEAAAAVLASGAAHNQIYELGGPLATYADLAAALSQVLGRHVAVQQLDDAAYQHSLVQVGLPEPVAAIFADMSAKIRAGALAVESPDLARLLRRPVTPLAEALKQMLPA